MMKLAGIPGCKYQYTVVNGTVVSYSVNHLYKDIHIHRTEKTVDDIFRFIDQSVILQVLPLRKLVEETMWIEVISYG